MYVCECVCVSVCVCSGEGGFVPGGALELRIDGGVPPRKMAKIFSETCNVQKDTHSGTSSQRKYTLMET